MKSWGKKLAIGAVCGAVAGVTVVGITVEIVGIGSTALESGAITAGQYVRMRAETGAGVVSFLSSKFTKLCVDGERNGVANEDYKPNNREQNDDGQPDAIIKYRSEGAWVSKMFVTYYLNAMTHIDKSTKCP